MRARWLVDGMNVIGSRPTGWWRDRPRAMRELVAELERFAEASGDEMAVVFDGRPFELESGRVEVSFASRRGPNAADDDIAALASAQPAGLTVVTSDADLVRRAGEAGAQTMGAGSFRRLLESGLGGAVPGNPGSSTPDEEAEMEGSEEQGQEFGSEESQGSEGAEGGFSSGGESGEGEAGGSSFEDESSSGGDEGSESGG